MSDGELYKNQETKKIRPNWSERDALCKLIWDKRFYFTKFNNVGLH